MTINLTHAATFEDGYYLVRLTQVGGLHLILIQTTMDGQKEIHFEDGRVLPLSRYIPSLYCSERIDPKNV